VGAGLGAHTVSLSLTRACARLASAERHLHEPVAGDTGQLGVALP